MQPMSLSSSQSSGPSLQSTFAFRPHVLLQTQERGRKPDGTPLLDYSDLAERIEVFKELFSAQSDHMMQGLKRSTDEHESQLRDERRNVELTREAIDRQREEQKKLYQSELHWRRGRDIAFSAHMMEWPACSDCLRTASRQLCALSVVPAAVLAYLACPATDRSRGGKGTIAHSSRAEDEGTR